MSEEEDVNENMKLMCKVFVNKNASEARQPPQQQQHQVPKMRFVQAILQLSIDRSHLNINYLNSQNGRKTRILIKKNIGKMFVKQVATGKATIQFRHPKMELYIQCEEFRNAQLRNLLTELKGASVTITNIASGFGGPSSALNSNGRANSQLVASMERRHGRRPANPFPVSLLIKSNQDEIFDKHLNLPQSIKFLVYNENLVVKLVEIPSVERQQKLFKNILSLKYLQVLELIQTGIESVPEELGELQLKKVNFKGNCLGIRPNFKWLSKEPLQNTLINLDLSDNKLTKFPMQIIKLTKIEFLYIKCNGLCAVPYSIRRLKTLRTLDLDDNKILTLPHTIYYINFLQFSLPESCYSKVVVVQPVAYTPYFPTLKLLAARVILDKKMVEVSKSVLPSDLYDMLLEYPLCATCNRLTSPQHFVRSKGEPFPDANVSFYFKHANPTLSMDKYFCSLKCAAKKKNNDGIGLAAQQ